MSNRNVLITLIVVVAMIVLISLISSTGRKLPTNQVTPTLTPVPTETTDEGFFDTQPIETETPSPIEANESPTKGKIATPTTTPIPTPTIRLSSPTESI